MVYVRYFSILYWNCACLRELLNLQLCMYALTLHACTCGWGVFNQVKFCTFAKLYMCGMHAGVWDACRCVGCMQVCGMHAGMWGACMHAGVWDACMQVCGMHAGVWGACRCVGCLHNNMHIYCLYNILFFSCTFYNIIIAT